MWHIDNQSMFVAKWQPGLQPEIPELTSAPVWIDFQNVPPQFYSEEGLEHIAGLVGEPLFLHPTTANMTNLSVARVFTIIDPTKPLPECVNVQFESGHTHRIDVSSPWLPPICDYCKEVGHSIKHCNTAPITCADCKSSGHELSNCPRKKKVSKVLEEKVVTQKTKGSQILDKYEKNEVFPSTLGGTLVIDIGLDKLQSASKPSGKAVGKQQMVTSSQNSDQSSSSEQESEFSQSQSDEDSYPELVESFKRVTSKRERNIHRQRKTHLAVERGKGIKIR